MTSKRVFALFLCTILAACATPGPGVENKEDRVPSVVFTPLPPAVALPAPAPPPVTVGSTKPVYNSEKPNLLYRDYLFVENNYPTSPFNLVIFPRKPVTKTDKEKYVFICELWRASFSSVKTTTIDQVYNQVPFYWMLSVKNNTDECDELIEKYDYDRARSFIVRKKLNLTKSYLVCDLGSSMITMDISRLFKPEDLELAMGVWIENMQDFPTSNKQLNPYSIVSSAKAVLGALGSLVALK